MIQISIVIITIVHLCFAKRYANYSIYNVFPINSEDLKFLEALYKNKHLDVVFTDNPIESDVVQILVNNQIESEFLDRLKHFKIVSKKLLNNAQEVFDEQLNVSSHVAKTQWETFRSLDEIYQWLNNTAKKYPYTYLESLGTTAENRDIPLFSIRIPPRPKYTNLKVIFEGGVHGNEWISTAAILKMIDEILNAETGSSYDSLKKKFFLYFIPVLNPDGYEYSQKEDRLWTKNRRRTSNTTIGVNLNRNFAYKFGAHDSSDDPNSQLYCGPFPFSEPETTNLRQFMFEGSKQLTFYFSVHGFGQKFILPYADSVTHVVNYHEVQNFARKAIDAMSDLESRPFKVGIAAEVLGKKYSGDSASWVKKSYHIPYTMTIQLRDRNDMGIAMPNNEIETIGKELTNGLTTFILSTGRFQTMHKQVKLKNNALHTACGGDILCTIFLVFALVS